MEYLREGHLNSFLAPGGRNLNNKVQLNAPLPGHGTWSNAVGWGGDAECSLAHFSYIGLLSSSVLRKNQELWNK